jgi:SnoaL-like domain
MMPTLEERVQRLEDIEDIRRLKIRYAGLCDAQYDLDGLASLFTDDAVWDGGSDFGVYQGKQAIQADAISRLVS